MTSEAAGDKPHWEHAGGLRLDLEPDRASTLYLLAWVSMVCALMGFVLAVPGLLAFALAVVTQSLAKRDLARMEGGQMDPAGRAATEGAQDLAIAGGFLGLLSLLLAPLCLGFVFSLCLALAQ